MVSVDIINEILEYLKKEGPTNTFRLARDIGLERHKLLNLLEKLEKKGAIEFKHGLAIFLEFPAEEKPKPAEIKESSPKPKKKVKPKKTKPKRKPAKPQAWQFFQAENKQLKEKLLEVEETMKKLEKKANAVPKTITKTIIKQIPITKTVIKKVSAPLPRKKKKNKRKTKKKIKRDISKKKSKIRKFKLPKFKFMKNIKQLKKPEFAKK